MKVAILCLCLVGITSAWPVSKSQTPSPALAHSLCTFLCTSARNTDFFIFSPFKVIQSKQHAISASSEEKYVSSFCLLIFFDKYFLFVCLFVFLQNTFSGPCSMIVDACRTCPHLAVMSQFQSRGLLMSTDFFLCHAAWLWTFISSISGPALEIFFS